MTSMQSELRVTVSLESRYSTNTGVRFDLSQEEIEQVLEANGFTGVKHEFLTDCGITGYSRNDYKVCDAEGNWHYAMSALSGIFKKRVMQMLTHPEE